MPGILTWVVFRHDIKTAVGGGSGQKLVGCGGNDVCLRMFASRVGRYQAAERDASVRVDASQFPNPYRHVRPSFKFDIADRPEEEGCFERLQRGMTITGMYSRKLTETTENAAT